MEQEIWKDIPEYEGLYQISNLGNIHGLRYNRVRLLRQTVKPNGYLKIELYKNKKKKTLHVHRLVAITFLLKKTRLNEVNHKDGNKTNNCVNNLEWCDRSFNNMHSYRTLGRVSAMLGKTGKDNKNSIPIKLTHKTTGEVLKFDSCKLAADELKVNQSCVIDALHGGSHRTTKGYFVNKV